MEGSSRSETKAGNLVKENALGIHWNIEKDNLGFYVNLRISPPQNVERF